MTGLLPRKLQELWDGMERNREITLGATAAQGGTRAKTVTVGGETTLPFLTFEGEIPNPPVVAGLIVDVVPEDWPDVLKNAKVMNLPAENTAIHAIRQHFLVDGHPGVVNPVGMAGGRLEKLALDVVRQRVQRLWPRRRTDLGV